LYWIELLNQSGFISTDEFVSINDDAKELLRMLRSAIITPKNNP
jgi:hypothetical protein